jgi:hypothetical protein
MLTFNGPRNALLSKNTIYSFAKESLFTDITPAAQTPNFFSVLKVFYFYRDIYMYVFYKIGVLRMSSVFVPFDSD